MKEPSLQNLKSHVQSYLTGDSSLGDFRDWFDKNTWGVAAKPHSPIYRPSGEIELRLAEFTSGHLSERELRELLGQVFATGSEKQEAQERAPSRPASLDHHR
jgi:hypothetical protein